MIFLIIGLVLFIILSVTLFVLLDDKNRKYKSLLCEFEREHGYNEKAKKILAKESEIYAAAEQEAERISHNARNDAARMTENIQEEVNGKQTILENLSAQISQLNEEINQLKTIVIPLRVEYASSEVAFYSPHYGDFQHSIEFERALSENRNAQKKMIQDGSCNQIYSVVDKKLTAVLKKLSLRAFNSECDLYMKSVDYKNVVQFENRILSAFEQINKLLNPYGIALAKEFYDLKISEIRLIHEMQEKKQAELEEQRRLKEIMREELRAEREMERAKQENEKEMDKYEKLLEKAVAMAERAKGEELDKMNVQIEILKQQLEEAREKERKISEAQKTKAGYVYVISNVGSFGENVYKIGMTRRLEPQERVDELGDASVPFPFDVHAMIWHENAPELESTLHRVFDKNRVNRINPRKEFFKISLERIADEVKKYKGDIQFTMLAEAKEYRQSISMEENIA
ncbi:MAG: DUF4041 domain-containing protein [Lentisphaerae bacterium]|nr:DUF4041 domain-containing protein [Lentisphaerota bacterium]